MWRTLAVATVICALAVSTADAQPRGKGHHRDHPRDRDYSNPLGSIFGGIIGGIIGSALDQEDEVEDEPEREALVPWTPEWYAYCTRRYRSFRPNTGYFTSYEGPQVFCR